MKKVDLVKGMAKDLGVTQVEAGKIYESFVKTAKEGLKADGEVDLVGFIKLEVRETKERSGECKIPGREKAWTKPAGKTVKSKVKDALIQEIVG